MTEVSNIQSGPSSAFEVKPGPPSAFGAKPGAEVTDVRGRKIKIRKLSPLDRMHLFEVLGPTLSENAMYLGYVMSAACVEAIDGDFEGFPTSKIRVEAMVGKLGEEGLEAVSKAYRDNFNAGESGDPNAIKKS